MDERILRIERFPRAGSPSGTGLGCIVAAVVPEAVATSGDVEVLAEGRWKLSCGRLSCWRLSC